MAEKPPWTPTAREAVQRMHLREQEEHRRRSVRQAYAELEEALLREAQQQRGMRLQFDSGARAYRIVLELELDDAQVVADALGWNDRAGQCIDALVTYARYQDLLMQEEVEQRTGVMRDGRGRTL